MIKPGKKRLDALVIERYPTLTRNLIQSLIIQGKVTVDGVITTKPGTQFKDEVVIQLAEEHAKYVSRAGYKLEAALQGFRVDVTGLTCMDAGISTGGFTDCLLQHGAARVYSVDVGHGQVHERVAKDQRVVLFEQTNLRLLEALPEKVDLVTLDLSFISLLKVMEVVAKQLKPDGRILALIKPQFEAEREQVRRGGLVTDPAVHDAVIRKIVAGFEAHGFKHEGTMESPILGASSGNKEFVAYFTR